MASITNASTPIQSKTLTSRLTAAFRIFDEKCRVYQYLFKRNRENIPFKTYSNPVVNAAIQNRIAFLDGKADSLYSLQIYYVVLFQGFRYETSIASSSRQTILRTTASRL